MTHSFLVTREGADRPDAGNMAAIFDASAALIAMLGGAGAMLAGEPADDGVDTAGEAMSLTMKFVARDNTVNFARWH
jgi:hypothetical protein